MQRSAQVSMRVCDYDKDLAFYIVKLGFDLVKDPHLDDKGKRWQPRQKSTPVIKSN